MSTRKFISPMDTLEPMREEEKKQRLVIILSMLTQNKNISLRSAQSTPSSRYYRSVKYKINTSSVIDNLDPRKLSPARANKTTIAWRKPSGYPLSQAKPSQERSRVKNSFTKEDMRVKQKDNLGNTIGKDGENPEYSSTKVTYLQTWDSLLHPQINSSNVDKLAHIQNSNLSLGRPEKIKNVRVFLPQIIDYDPSMFCSLDPVAIPIEHIQRGIIELNKQLPEPKRQMAQIRSEMRSFKAKILKELDETKEEGVKGFQKLWGMLRADRVVFQEGIMKLKRNCRDLFELDQEFKTNFETTKPRVQVLQEQLFSNRPFQLESNLDYEQQFPQKYF